MEDFGGSPISIYVLLFFERMKAECFVESTIWRLTATC